MALATVLVVDDAPLTRRLLRRALEGRGFAVVEATDGNHALEACRHESPDVIVLDLDFGGGPEEGAATLRALQESPRTARTPVIVINGDAIESDDGEVVARVQEELTVLSRRRASEEQAEALAEAAVDTLTSLGTRQSLDDELAQLQQAVGDAEVSVFVVDLDDFKALNESRGRLMGDAVLRIAGRRLTTIVGGLGLLVRWGGAEFLVVVPQSVAPDPELFADRMRTAISDMPFRIEPEPPLTVTASVGGSSAPLAEFGPGVERAEAALYRAKLSGRNSVAFG